MVRSQQRTRGRWAGLRLQPARLWSAGYGAPGYGAPTYGYVDPLAKSKLVAGLLGIFLGGFRIHRFYLGFTTIGVVQIIVTIVTCGIGALWGRSKASCTWWARAGSPPTPTDARCANSGHGDGVVPAC